MRHVLIGRLIGRLIGPLPGPLLAPLLALVLAACGDPAPGGQVVATVNGDEITRPQLNAALAGGKASTGKDAEALRNAALDLLVTQQLVVQEAKRQGIDKSQEYLLAMRAAEDRILSDMLSRKLVQGLRTPAVAKVGQFVRNNPSRFADREILAVDQLRFPAASLASAPLEDAHSLAEAVSRLSAAGIRFERGRAAIDTSAITPELHARLLALPPGEPFIATEGGMTLVSTITGRQPAPITGDAATRLARQVIGQQDARAVLTKQLETLRRSAQIDYQPGFAAPKPSNAAPSATRQ